MVLLVGGDRPTETLGRLLLLPLLESLCTRSYETGDHSVVCGSLVQQTSPKFLHRRDSTTCCDHRTGLTMIYNNRSHKNSLVVW